MSDNLFDIWFPNQGVFLIILSNVTLLLFQVMNNDKSWRGMLIKDNEGDWGVCVAVWRGMKKGVPGVAGKPSLITLILHTTTVLPTVLLLA